MQYVPQHNAVVTADGKGRVEVWDASDFGAPKTVRYQFKSETDLFEFQKCKTYPVSITASPDGKWLGSMGKDRQIRCVPGDRLSLLLYLSFSCTLAWCCAAIFYASLLSLIAYVSVFSFVTGKLHRKYDESLKVCQQLQRGNLPLYHLDDIDFGRRMAMEKELDAPDGPPQNVVFDESGNFIIYPTLFGIKIVNMVTNRLARLLGKVETNERHLTLALYQGRPKLSMATGRVEAAKEDDPMIICNSFKTQRLYFYTKHEPDTEMHALFYIICSFSVFASSVLFVLAVCCASLRRSSPPLFSVAVARTARAAMCLTRSRPRRTRRL